MVLETPQYGNRSCRGVPLPFQKMAWLAEYAQKQGRVLLRTDIDLVNFFNSVNHSCMFAVMREFGFPDVDLLESLYDNASMVIVTPDLPAALAFPEGTVMWPEAMLDKLRKLRRALHPLGDAASVMSPLFSHRDARRPWQENAMTRASTSQPDTACPSSIARGACLMGARRHRRSARRAP